MGPTMTDAFRTAFEAHRVGDFEAAERGYRQFPNHKDALQNLAALYNEIGRGPEAEAILRHILAHFPDYAPSRYSLAFRLLETRRYAEAWPLHEARRAVLPLRNPVTDAPEWRGEPLTGKRLVVVAEQGLGDQMMFGRYLPTLRSMGAEVVVACDPRSMSRLFEWAGFRTHPYFAGRTGLPETDMWTFCGSLPLHIPTHGPVDPVYLPRGSGGGGVGVVAKGSAAHLMDAYRSLSGGAEACLLSLGRNLLPQGTGALDYLETAKIVAGLDLVITVDTSIAHLAGAMSVPCWVMLSSIGMDWRWNDGVRSDWYPSARLFRQQTPGDWSSVIADVRAALG